MAAGALDVTLGTSGALSTTLEVNAGVNPPGVDYTVVYHLGPGEVRTEYLDGADEFCGNSAQVRRTPGAGTVAQPVSQQCSEFGTRCPGER